jgi:hypothetical protein
MEGAANDIVAVAVDAPEDAPAVGEAGGAVVGVPEGGEEAGGTAEDKAARRKDANRVSAKKSRERKAQTLESVKKENDELKAQVAALQVALAAAEGRPPPPPPAAALPSADGLLAFDAGGATGETAGDADAALPIKKQKR